MFLRKNIREMNSMDLLPPEIWMYILLQDIETYQKLSQVDRSLRELAHSSYVLTQKEKRLLQAEVNETDTALFYGNCSYGPCEVWSEEEKIVSGQYDHGKHGYWLFPGSRRYYEHDILLQSNVSLQSNVNISWKPGPALKVEEEEDRLGMLIAYYLTKSSRQYQFFHYLDRAVVRDKNSEIILEVSMDDGRLIFSNPQELSKDVLFHSIIISWEYYPDGTPKRKGVYFQDRHDGELLTWHPNGVLSSKKIIYGEKMYSEERWDHHGVLTFRRSY